MSATGAEEHSLRRRKAVYGRRPNHRESTPTHPSSGRKSPGRRSSDPSGTDPEIQPTEETHHQDEPDEPDTIIVVRYVRDAELNCSHGMKAVDNEEGSTTSYCTARESTATDTCTDQDLHTHDSKESTPTGEVLEDKEHTPTEAEDRKEHIPTESTQVEGDEEHTPEESAETEVKLEGQPSPHQDVSKTDHHEQGVDAATTEKSGKESEMKKRKKHYSKSHSNSSSSSSSSNSSTSSSDSDYESLSKDEGVSRRKALDSAEQRRNKQARKEQKREHQAHRRKDQERKHTDTSEPQELESAHQSDARESLKQTGKEISKRELTDESDHPDVGAEMITAAMHTSGFISRLFLILYPIISPIQYILPSFLRRKFIAVMSWAILHYRLSFTLVVLIFTTIFLCLPDTFLPEADTIESARSAKNLYCNQSIVNDLVLKQLKSWKSARTSEACEYIVCDNPSEIGTGLGQELPPINVGYLTGLASYACNLPKEEVLLVWGASGCGMETGLAYMVQMWREQGRVVINVDLSRFEGEHGDFLDFIHRATIDGFHGHKLSSAAIQALEELLNNGTQKKAHDDGDGFMTLLKKLALKTLSILPFVSYTFQQKLEGVFNSKLAALDSFLLSFVTGEEDAFSEINFQSFLSAINILVNYQPSLAPIVIFNQLDAVSFLGGSEGRTIIDDLLHTLEEHEQLENILPVIISSSNTLWIRKANILGLQSLFIPYEVAELGKENALKLLTEKLQIWTEDELNQIWDALGGHYKSLEEVYKYHKFFGRSIEDAIHRVNEFTYTALSTFLSQLNISDQEVQDKEEPSVVEVLKHLVQDNQLTIEDTEDVPPAIESLLHAGVLHMDIDFKLSPTSKSMQHAIEKYLQTLQTSA